jgi:(2Fe-2S) ferredoxin
MMYPDNPEPWSFNWEGTFLGVARDEIGKLKYLRLQVLQEEVQIKIPKELRGFVRFHLQPGEAIQVSGVGKVDQYTNQFKLKAYQISPTHLITTPSDTFLNPKPSQPSAPNKASRSKPKTKILVCQKSDCRKRGGSQMLQELEQMLRDRNLQDCVALEPTGCLKCCSKAPNFVVLPGKNFYNRVKPNELVALLQKRLSS